MKVPQQQGPVIASKAQAHSAPSQSLSLGKEDTSTSEFQDLRPESIAQRQLSDEIATTPPNDNDPLAQRKNDTGLPDDLKSGIENLSGYIMDDVKVHYNSSKPAQLNAHAYAQGTDIHVASGQEKHLPHEAWHVVQQKQGRVQPTMQMQGVAINDDVGLETEADVMGAKAVELNQSTGIPNIFEVQTHTSKVSQRIAWDDKGNGTGDLTDDGKVPPLNGVSQSASTFEMNVAGKAFNGHLYVAQEVTGTTKTDVIVKIAETIGALNIPESNYFLSKKALGSVGVSGSVNLANIVDGGKRNDYRQKLDPFIIKVGGRMEDGVRIALYYQFGVDSYGYIVQIEQEGKRYKMHSERGQEALLLDQTPKLKKNELDDPILDYYSSAHDTDTPDMSISDIAGKSTTGSDTQVYYKNRNQSQDPNKKALKEKSRRLDAITKIGGEGARWQCVREMAAKGKLTDNTRFLTENPENSWRKYNTYIGMTFQDLWGSWSSLFFSEFNIPDEEVADVIEMEFDNDNKKIVRIKVKEATENDYLL